MLFTEDDFNKARDILSLKYLKEDEDILGKLKSSEKFTGSDKKLYEDFVKYCWNFEGWPTLNSFVIISRAIEFIKKNPSSNTKVLSYALEEMLHLIGTKSISKKD